MDALNDLAKIRLDVNPYGFGTSGKLTAENGILEALPNKFIYFGFWSFAFESSLMDKEKLAALYDYWAAYIGKRVYWTSLSERGNILELDGEKFAFVKLTSLISVSAPEVVARNVHEDGEGSFGVEQ